VAACKASKRLQTAAHQRTELSGSEFRIVVVTEGNFEMMTQGERKAGCWYSNCFSFFT